MNVVKHMVVLSKMRHSQVCARAVTYQQFEKYKPKRMLKLLYKFRDYKHALTLIDNLNFKQYLPQVYEDWTSTMLRVSSLPDHQLRSRLELKFENLKQKIAAEQDIPLMPLEHRLNPMNKGDGSGSLY